MKHHIRKVLNDDAPPKTISSDISPSPPPSTNASTARKPLKPTSSFDASMVLTVMFIFTALLFLGFFSVFIGRFSGQNSFENSRRRRQQQRMSSSAASTPSGPTNQGLDPATVRSLPLFAYDGNEKEPSDCPVCLGEFEENEIVKLIPYCRHVFHPQCIDTWFSSHVSCPLCRTTQLFRLASSSSSKDVRFNALEEERLSESPDVSTVRNGDVLIDTVR